MQVKLFGFGHFFNLTSSKKKKERKKKKEKKEMHRFYLLSYSYRIS